MFSNFYHGFYYTALIVSATVSLWLFAKASSPFRWLAILIVFTMISEITAKYLGVNYDNNSIVYHIFTPIEYLIYAVIFYKFFKSRRWNGFFISSVLGIFLLAILNAKFLQPVHVDNSNIMMVENILLVFLSLMLFVRIRTSHHSKNILLEGVFWFNSMVLIYYTFNILIAGFHSFEVYKYQNPPMVIYKINLLMSALLYLVYTLSITLNVMHRENLNVAYE